MPLNLGWEDMLISSHRIHYYILFVCWFELSYTCIPGDKSSSSSRWLLGFGTGSAFVRISFQIWLAGMLVPTLNLEWGEDPWIPGSTEAPILVRELIDSDLGCWDSDILLQHFFLWINVLRNILKIKNSTSEHDLLMCIWSVPQLISGTTKRKF